MQLNLFALAALASAVLAQAPQSLNATLAGNNQTTMLASLLGSSPAIVSALSAASNVTILAPSNSALQALLNTTAGKALATDPGAIQALLEYHVLNGTYDASAITNMPAFIPTYLTNTSYANVTGGQVVEALTVDNNVTFFSGLLANSTVVEANLNFTGGVIHVINSVLTIPQNATSTALAAGLTSLYGALNATGLLDTVDGLGNVTIFAPSNKAFEAIGSGLANLSVSDLTSILTYHVVVGEEPFYSSDLANDTSVPTVNGGNITVTLHQNGTVFVNDAMVVTPNVLIAGGVVHVIDEVLNPNSTAVANASATAGSPAFSGASSVSSPPFASGAPPASTTIAGVGSSSSKAAGAPMITGAVGAAALFGAGAAGLIAQL